MRLLHIQGRPWGDKPLEISPCEFVPSDVPPYIILSHRWREDEVLFADMSEPIAAGVRQKKGYAKLESSCRIALQMDVPYLWMDTCCIDKGSSAELSEAINSMNEYYANAFQCIVYLDDVHDIETYRGSRTRTLQELIAPQDVTSYSESWSRLGTKKSLVSLVALASGIAWTALGDRDVSRGICVSEKMSWAACRVTTRPEDESYTLMGLFGVNMPPLYGEGRKRAFRRLQLEIMQTSADHTLFTWNSSIANGDMLAPNVSCFSDGAHYHQYDYEYNFLRQTKYIKPDFTMTNVGLHIQLPL
ncbi:hypothetical protein CC86DRAFT_307699, partial [Ophiobolus disseminans]